MLTDSKSHPSSVAVVRSVVDTATARYERNMEGVVREFSVGKDSAQQFLEIIANLPLRHDGPLGKQQGNLVCHYYAQIGESRATLAYTPGQAKLMLDGRYGKDPGSEKERAKIADGLGRATAQRYEVGELTGHTTYNQTS